MNTTANQKLLTNPDTLNMAIDNMLWFSRSVIGFIGSLFAILSLFVLLTPLNIIISLKSVYLYIKSSLKFRLYSYAKLRKEHRELKEIYDVLTKRLNKLRGMGVFRRMLLFGVGIRMFVDVKDCDRLNRREATYNKLQRSFQEVKDIQSGKITPKSIDTLLNELKTNNY